MAERVGIRGLGRIGRNRRERELGVSNGVGRSFGKSLCSMLRSRLEVRSTGGFVSGEAWAVLIYRGLALAAFLLWWFLNAA